MPGSLHVSQTIMGIHSDDMGISLKHWFSVSGSRSGPKIFISNKCLSDIDTIGLLTTLHQKFKIVFLPKVLSSSWFIPFSPNLFLHHIHSPWQGPFPGFPVAPSDESPGSPINCLSHDSLKGKAVLQSSHPRTSCLSVCPYVQQGFRGAKRTAALPF